jgi:hypothetical protein
VCQGHSQLARQLTSGADSSEALGQTEFCLARRLINLANSRRRTTTAASRESCTKPLGRLVATRSNNFSDQVRDSVLQHFIEAGDATAGGVKGRRPGPIRQPSTATCSVQLRRLLQTSHVTPSE